MKTMTCRQLGGACDQEFRAKTFESMAEQSMYHGKEMFEKGEEAHLNAQREMSEKMKDPEAMKRWMDGKRQEFEALPDSG